MTKTGSVLLLGMLVALPLAAAERTVGAAAGPQNNQQALEQFRDDLQSTETGVLQKTLLLTTDEATKFWPVFQRFQNEQQAIIDGQLAAVESLADNYDKLSGEEAVAFIEAFLERDQRIHDLRVKYLAEFLKVLPPNKAARTIQISRRLGLAGQLKLSSSIPLVH